MRNVRELRVGDLLLYDNGAICVVYSTDENFYGLFYADGDKIFKARTPQDFYRKVVVGIKVIRK